MIGAIALTGVAAVACGYHAYHRLQGTDGSANVQLHIDHFREVHHVQPVVIPPRTESGIPIALPIPGRVRRKATSFDLFDTLITRDLPSPEMIFDLVESVSGVKGFAEARKIAGGICGPSCLGDIAEIYRHLSQNKKLASLNPVIDLDALRAAEWKMELDHAVMIRSNVDKLMAIQDGSAIIIVSDMYYNADELRELLVHLKFPRLDEITIFTSRSGKSDGWVWRVLSEVFEIISHTGDNSRSDVSSPMNSRLVKTAIHSATAHSPTVGECVMFNTSSDPDSAERKFGSLMRRLSMGNPYSAEKERMKFIWYRLHSAYTVPVFWFFLNSIREVLHANPKITRIAAVSRDCINLEPLMQRFLLGDKGVLLEKDGVTERPMVISRIHLARRFLIKQLKTPCQDYLDYLKETLGGDTMQEQTLLVDINGTYRSLSNVIIKYFDAKIPRAHFLSLQNGSVLTRLKGLLTAAIPGIDTNIVEWVNVAACGGLIDWNPRSEPFGGPVRTACEYSDLSLEVTDRMFSEDIIPVLSSGDWSVMPRTRTMSALLQKATTTTGTEIRHDDWQRSLYTTITPGRTPESHRYCELSLSIARLLSLYHNRPTKDPVKIFDVAGSLKVPRKSPTLVQWVEAMKDRAVVVTSDENPELGVLTAANYGDAEILCSLHAKNIREILAVYVMDIGEKQEEGIPGFESLPIAVWTLTEGEGLNKGAVYVFNQIKTTRKAVPADEEFDLDDLPEVPSHSRMMA